MKITPNMTNDGHDTNISFTSSYARNAISQLLNNTYFMNNTLLMLTFDESETYTLPNKVFTILLGGAIPENLKGTTDDTFYNHYSSIATVAMNWGLPSLGRWDCEANVFALVANKTGYKNAAVDLTNLYFNTSYPGPLSDTLYVPRWPVPNTSANCASGNGILASVKSTWGNSSETYNYTNAYPYDATSGNNVGGTPITGGSINGTATTSSTAASSSKAAGAMVSVNGWLMAVAAMAVGLLPV
jgi:acid phosphatase